MTTLIQFTIAAALILSIIVPFGYFFLGEKNKKRYKKSLGVNCFFFFGTLVLASVLSLGGAGSVQAAEAAADVAATGAAAGGFPSQPRLFPIRAFSNADRAFHVTGSARSPPLRAQAARSPRSRRFRAASPAPSSFRRSRRRFSARGTTPHSGDSRRRSA